MNWYTIQRWFMYRFFCKRGKHSMIENQWGHHHEHVVNYYAYCSYCDHKQIYKTEISKNLPGIGYFDTGHSGVDYSQQVENK